MDIPYPSDRKLAKKLRKLGLYPHCNVSDDLDIEYSVVKHDEYSATHTWKILRNKKVRCIIQCGSDGYSGCSSTTYEFH